VSKASFRDFVTVSQLVNYPPGQMQFVREFGAFLNARNLHDQYGRPYSKQRPLSFEEWERWLERAAELGAAAFEVADPGNPDKAKRLVRFAGLFGDALAKRWLWLKKARADGETPEEAEARFDREAAHEERGCSPTVRRSSTSRYRGAAEAEI
jgi:hypothetical protein